MSVQPAAANAKPLPPYTLQKTLLGQKTPLNRNAQDAANALLAVRGLARTARPALDPQTRCWALDQGAALVSTRFFKHFKAVAHRRQFVLAREKVRRSVGATLRSPSSRSATAAVRWLAASFKSIETVWGVCSDLGRAFPAARLVQVGSCDSRPGATWTLTTGTWESISNWRPRDQVTPAIAFRSC